MKKKKGSCMEGDAELPEIQAEALLYEVWPIAALCVHIGDERKKIFCPDHEPLKQIQWIEKQGVDYGASEVALVLREAKRYVDGKKVTDKEKFEELLRHAVGHIQEKIVEKAVPQIQHGQKFKGNVRGPGKTSQLLDEELKIILERLGTEATFKDIIREIEIEAEGWTSFFQGVDWEKQKIFFKDPGRRDHEDEISFKAIQNRMTKLKKNLFGHKS